MRSRSPKCFTCQHENRGGHRSHSGSILLLDELPANFKIFFFFSPEFTYYHSARALRTSLGIFLERDRTSAAGHAYVQCLIKAHSDELPATKTHLDPPLCGSTKARVSVAGGLPNIRYYAQSTTDEK